MGSVYRARDLRLDRDVALKILAPPYRDDAAYVDRFLSEARTAASISHPSLVHVYDSGSDGDVHYIAMELLEGYRPLRDVVRGDAPVAVDYAASSALEVLAGLRAVHARGLLHCDVKSANVMVRGSSVKLIDFGIARSRADESPDGRSIGSLHYMAPEQLLGRRLTPASDLYSVGVVLYESLTGELPYRGSNPAAVATAQTRSALEPPARRNPAVSQRLDRVVVRALELDPAHRYQSADEMAAALEAARGPDAIADWGADDRTQPHVVPRSVAVAAGRDVHAREFGDPRSVAARAPARPPVPHPAPRPARPRRGFPWGVAAIGVTLAVLGLVVVMGLRGAGIEIGPPVTRTPGPGEVAVPNVVGLTEADAIAAANAAELNWTLWFDTDPEQPVGVYAQEPSAGTIVRRGADFEFWANRHP